VFGNGAGTQAEYADLTAWAHKPASVDWAVAAAAGVAGETAERGLQLLSVKSGETVFVDGGAVVVQVARPRACGDRVGGPRQPGPPA
jgi:NADPH:quinone reductase-like Zn-dependent oxidoreductase